LPEGSSGPTRSGLPGRPSVANFKEAVFFVNTVAGLAEKAGHHPDIRVAYNRVTPILSTHDAGGLTGKDFDLARRIEAAA